MILKSLNLLKVKSQFLCKCYKSNQVVFVSRVFPRICLHRQTKTHNVREAGQRSTISDILEQESALFSRRPDRVTARLRAET